MTPLLFLPLLATAGSLVPATVAQQASSFPVDAATALQYDCGPLCQTILQATTQADLALTGTTFDSEFYSVASNFSTAKPGDLLKLKPVDPTNLTVISGVSVYRIQYVSEDLDGTRLPVSGFVALPSSLPASGAFPLVAFAHGTFGLYPGCAVSNGPDLFDYRSWSLLSERGYAVVATDYAGLGTNGTSHKYCAFPAHANDIFHSITAARQAFGAVLSKPWMAVGHSQGGGAVWKLAESVDDLSRKHATDEAAHYLGTVALAPATKVWDLAKFAVQTLPSQPNIHKYSVTSLLPFLQIAIHRVYPNYGTSILSETMSKRVGLANKAQLCASGLLGLTADLDFNNLTTLTTTGATPEDIRIAEEFQNRTAPANGARAHGPILVVQGVNDTAILAEITEKAWETACAAGNEVKLMLYPKQDHSGVLTAAAPDWLEWIEARFHGAHGRETVCPDAVASKCSKVTKQPFDMKYVKAEPEIDLDSFTFN